MKFDYHLFANINDYKSELARNSNFILVFETGDINDRYLSQIVNDCVSTICFQGIVFRLNLDKLVFARLLFYNTFLKTLILSQKKVGLWGIPICMKKRLLSKYFYIRYFTLQISDFTSSQKDRDHGLILLPACNRCTYINNCVGVGTANIDTYKPEIIKRNSTNKHIPVSNDPFGKKYPFLSSQHKRFHQYCIKNDNGLSDRSIFYATNIDHGSDYSYPERFIYSAYLISPEETEKEYSFLKKNCLDTKFVDFMESQTIMNETEQIGYAIAQKENLIRESFYISSPEKFGKLLLSKFNIDYSIPQTKDMRLYGIGMDVRDSKIVSYKLYFRSSEAFVRSYIEPFVLKGKRFDSKGQFIVLRLNEQQEYISYKIELKINRSNLQNFRDYIDNYSFFYNNFEELGIYIIAIEFDNNKVSKLNFYHRNKFFEINHN